jgi:hypothetical protein
MSQHQKSVDTDKMQTKNNKKVYTDDELDNLPVTDQEFEDFMCPSNLDESTTQEPVDWVIPNIID